jgi:hypothetical protein
VLLRTTQGAPVADGVQQSAIEQVPVVLRERPDDLDELYQAERKEWGSDHDF